MCGVSCVAAPQPGLLPQERERESGHGESGHGEREVGMETLNSLLVRFMTYGRQTGFPPHRCPRTLVLLEN